MVQAIDGLLLHGHIGLGLGHLRRQPPGLKPRQQLPLLDPIAFLHQHRGNALAAVERQLHLAQVHVAVQRQLGALVVAAQGPPQCRPNDDDNDDSAGDQGNGSRDLWHTVTCFRRS